MQASQPKHRIIIHKFPIQTTLYIKEKLQRGLTNFINHESFGGILLFFCVVLAMAVANSEYKNIYFALLNEEFGAFFGNQKIQISVGHFVNDILMTLFCWL